MRASLSFTRGVFDHSQSESVTIMVLFHIAHIIVLQPGLGKGFQSECRPNFDKFDAFQQYSLSKKREKVIGLRDHNLPT